MVFNFGFNVLILYLILTLKNHNAVFQSIIGLPHGSLGARGHSRLNIRRQKYDDIVRNPYYAGDYKME